MQQVKQRGSTLLKVVSIILIILGAGSLIGGLASAGMGAMSASMLGLDEFGMQYFRVSGIISLITGVSFLCIGIFGVRLCNREGKEGLLLLLGIVLILVVVFTTLYNATMADIEAYVMQQLIDVQLAQYGFAATDTNIGSFSSSSPIMIIFNFILPVLFVVGALLNRMPPKIVYPGYMPGEQGANPYSPPPGMSSGAEQPDRQQ